MNELLFAEWDVVMEYRQLMLNEWMERAEEEFEIWAEIVREKAAKEAKENGEEWTDWNEDQLENWILDQKEKDEERQHEKFEEWFEDHYQDWIDKLNEKREEMNAV